MQKNNDNDNNDKNNDSNLYSAFRAKDARFDGRFVVGISSTGIYCRPVCKAKMPKPENCNYFDTPAQAERQGYRPCLLCRPELAAGLARIDSTENLAYKAARLLEQSCGDEKTLQSIAKRLGYTDRHLRRAFLAQYKVTPVQYLQTCRLLLAKNLLTDTGLSVLDVAMAAGFGSVRRFNELFKKQYNLSPTCLRKKAQEGKQKTGEVTLALGYRPPYDWQKLLDFFVGRAITGVESVENGEYRRVVQMISAGGEEIHGWLRAGHRPEKNAIAVTVSEGLLPVLPQVLAKVRSLFDLHCDPREVFLTLEKMNGLRPNLCIEGTRVPGCFDAFEMAVRAVLGQQITVRAASTLAARIVQAFGTPVETGIDGLTHIFPSPQVFIAMGQDIQDNLGRLGITSARSATILQLAKALASKDIDFDSHLPQEQMKKLMQIKGIGSWTANYIAMRAMEWPDAFLETDAGVRHALPDYSPKELLLLAEDWRPWRSYAVLNLWNTL